MLIGGMSKGTPQLARPRFELLRPVGTSEVAEAWLARDLADNGTVALKLAQGELGRLVLAREAEQVSLIASPLLPELIDVGFLRTDGSSAFVVEDSGDARPFIALRWVDGSTLSTPPAGADRQRAALETARDVGEALSELHGLGLAHGDLAPRNLVSGVDGRVHVIDLGLVVEASATALHGGTPRYLGLRDAELGDARARDLLALGIVLAELVDPRVAGSDEPIPIARAGLLEGPVGTLCAALVAPSPSGRPSAAWVAETAREALRALGARGEEDDVGASIRLRLRRIRVSYLRLRREELERATDARSDVAPWAFEAITRVQRARAMARGGAASDRDASTTLGPLEPERVARWLTALAGPSVASWPIDAITAAPERDLAAALCRLAERMRPEFFSFADVEKALRHTDSASPSAAPIRPTISSMGNDAAGPFTAERAATLALELATIAPGEDAIGAVERRQDAPMTLVLAATEALRRSGQLGRARSLVMRAAGEPRAAGLEAEVLRRSGDHALATEVARRALAAGPDPRGRARTVLARLAFDAGKLDEVDELTREATSAGPYEVAALAAGARGDTAGALLLVTRGEAFARDSEARARLAGVRGYVLHGADPVRSMQAYSSAVEHAVRSGALVEEATYRIGEAASAVDSGDLALALETSRRSALLWEHLGRPALAARAELARAAAFATAGAPYDAARAARSAIAWAHAIGDERAVAYAYWAIADAHGTDADEAREAARQAATRLTALGSGRLRCATTGAAGGATAVGAEAREDRRATEVTVDELRAAARLVEHDSGALDVDLIGELDERVASEASLSACARLEWLGARAARLASGSSAEVGIGPIRILSTICALADAHAPVGSRGPALAAGLALATREGHGEQAQRLLGALADAGRDLLRRTSPELAASVRALPWVARGTSGPDTALQPEQARELETLVRLLGERERLSSLLARVVDALVLWTGVERGLLLLRAPDGRLVPRAARNLARADLQGEQLALSQTLAHRALEAREPVVAVDAAGELPSLHQSVHTLKLRSVLAVPLLARGEALGVVYLDDRVRRGAFGERELSWTRTIASLAALAIADARDQVLLRRATRRAERTAAKLAETLAHREAALDVAERELAKTRDGRDTRFEYAAIVGESEPMRAMLRVVDRVTTSDIPVLLSGESGSGKELVASAIHANGPRAGRAFVSENCSAIPEGLLESALFGHVRGAFTGADRARAGLFDVADGGTLFLDEIGEMSLAMQAKLLRVLEDGIVRPVGAERERKVDVRIVTATHRDLAAMVKAKTFREDLLYRLAIITIAIPPLRERRDDIPMLVEHLLRKHAKGAPVRIAAAAMERLVAYSWPGNVRQLENEIRRALVLSGGTIERTDLSPDIAEGAMAPGPELGLDVRARIDALETELVREAMRRTAGNQTQAAKLLGLSRFGLQKMIKRLSLV